MTTVVLRGNGALLEGALARVRARCKLWFFLGTLPVIIATIKRPLRKEQKLSKSFWGLLAIIKKPQEDRWCACNYGFLGFYGLFGWVHLGMVHRCLTTNGWHGADARRARCNNSHLVLFDLWCPVKCPGLGNKAHPEKIWKKCEPP